MGDANQPGVRLERQHEALRPHDWPLPGPAVGDTPRIITIMWNGTPTLVVGFGCKNGGFYIVRASDGMILAHTPLYTGPPTDPLNPPPDKRTLALPGPIGGLQTGCATDGKRVYTNGIDSIQLGTQESIAENRPPTAGRVVAISLDTKKEHWRHERPKVASVGGPLPKPIFKNIGDPVASGIAVANDVVYFTTLRPASCWLWTPRPASNCARSNCRPCGPDRPYRVAAFMSVRETSSCPTLSSSVQRTPRARFSPSACRVKMKSAVWAAVRNRRM